MTGTSGNGLRKGHCGQWHYVIRAPSLVLHLYRLRVAVLIQLRTIDFLALNEIRFVVLWVQLGEPIMAKTIAFPT